MPPRTAIPSVDNDTIKSKLAARLSIDVKTIALHPNLKGKEYLQITLMAQEELVSLREQIEHSLYQSMIRNNRISDEPKSKSLFLNKEQVGILIGEKLSPDSKSAMHRYIHFQPTDIEINGELVWVQFLDTSGIDKELKAKTIAHKMNNNIAMQKHFAVIKGSLGEQVTFVQWHDDAHVSFLWIHASKLYEMYRDAFIQEYARLFSYRVHAIQDTPYLQLFEANKHRISISLLLSDYKRSQKKLNVFSDLVFEPLPAGCGYEVNISDSDRVIKDILVLAKAHKILLTVEKREDKLYFSEEAYKAWQTICKQRLSKPKKVSSAEIPFSKYTSPLGVVYYIHCPTTKRSHALATHLNSTTKLTTKADIFGADYSSFPDIVYIEEKEYLAWLALKKADPVAFEDIPFEQKKYLEQLTKELYSPVIEYEPTLIAETISALEKRVPDHHLLSLLKIGFRLKTEFLDSELKANEARLDESRSNSAEQVVVSSRKLLRKTNTRKLLIKLANLLGLQTSHTRFPPEFIVNLAGFCQLIAKYILEDLGWSRKELEHVIKRYIFLLNEHPEIRFDETQDTILLKSKDCELDLFNLVIIDESAIESLSLNKILSQLFCTLSEIVFYKTYAEVAVEYQDHLHDESVAESLVERTRQKKSAKMNATLQLAHARPDIIRSALSTQGYTRVDRSNIEHGGLGLFVHNMGDKPWTMNPGDIISWFDGDLCNDSDITPDKDPTEFISIGGMRGTNAPLIRASKNPEHPGNTYFANHSEKNNADFKTIYANKLPVARVLMYTGPSITFQPLDRLGMLAESIEIVANYGSNAARLIHNIVDPVPYVPTVHWRPIERAEGLQYGDIEVPESLDESEGSSDDEVASTPVVEVSISFEQVLMSIKQKLDINDDKRFELKAGVLESGVCDYVQIKCETKEALDSIKTTIQHILYHAMILENKITFERGLSIRLFRTQITALLHKKISWGQTTRAPILHHFLHCMPSKLGVWVQFLDTQGLDKDYSAQKIACLLNLMIKNTRLKNKPYQAIKDKLGEQGLFLGYDSKERGLSFIWARDADLYKEVRKIFVAVHADTHIPHRSEDTPYPELFSRYSEQLTSDLLIVRYGIKNPEFDVLRGLAFTESFDKKSYQARPHNKALTKYPKLVACMKKIMEYAHTAYGVDLALTLQGDYICFSLEDYEKWNQIILRAQAKTKTLYTQLPFSLYSSAMGSFYLYMPDATDPKSIIYKLKKTPHGKETFFIDRSLPRALIGARRDNFKHWLAACHGAQPKDAMAIPQRQKDYILRLKAAHYAPYIVYDAHKLEAAKRLLKKRIAPDLVPFILSGFESRYEIFPEKDALEDGDKPLDIKWITLRKKLVQVLQYRLVGGVCRSTFLFDYCAILARLCIDRYQCDVSILTDIINRHIHSLNRGLKLSFSSEKNDVMLTSSKGVWGLLFNNSFELTDLTPIQEFELKTQLTLIFCALSEAIVFYYYELALKKALTRKISVLDDRDEEPNLKRRKNAEDHSHGFFSTISSVSLSDPAASADLYISSNADDRVDEDIQPTLSN